MTAGSDELNGIFCRTSSSRVGCFKVPFVVVVVMVVFCLVVAVVGGGFVWLLQCSCVGSEKCNAKKQDLVTF